VGRGLVGELEVGWMKEGKKKGIREGRTDGQIIE